ncbi:polyribonucleotide 5'-hydroxyl-kinase Clp1-like [Gordionus sp. m RMFG-2023]|uniref:polyribonucleotide 5'-hydroxyl-kinase Clp1-like n=1 Tax=Gordionus sp. m RMFG-2023 TaxID=3053472 RepID=UPI0031FDB783
MTDKKNEVKNEQAFDLESESELRIEIEEENIAFLTLKSGTAEIFGSELILDKPITLNHGSKIAVYTWHGCNILLRVENIIKENSHIHKLNVNKEENDDDNVDNKNLIDYIAYISKETPNICYANTHAVLERMRRSAKEKTTRGPRVMIVGPVDVGKSSLCALLLNYAVRMGWKPIYVDLDVGQGSISIPGNLSAIQVEKTIDIEESYYLYSNTASPMVIHFGRISPGDNIKLYLHCITVLSQIVEKKCTDKPRGIISWLGSQILIKFNYMFL